MFIYPRFPFNSPPTFPIYLLCDSKNRIVKRKKREKKNFFFSRIMITIHIYIPYQIINKLRRQLFGFFFFFFLNIIIYIYIYIL